MIPQQGTSQITPADLAMLARVRAGDAAAEEAVLRRFEPFLLWRASRTFVFETLVSREDLLQFFRITTVLCARGWRPDGFAGFSHYLYKSLTRTECSLVKRTREGGFSTGKGDAPYVVSGDMKVSNGEGTAIRLMELQVDPESEGPYEEIEDADLLRDLLAGCDPARLELIADLFGLEGRPTRTLRGLGAILGLTGQGVNHRLMQEIRRIRERNAHLDDMPSPRAHVLPGLLRGNGIRV